MRVVVDKSEQELAKLMRAVEQDPASWESWTCLHMHIEPRRDYDRYVAAMGLVIAEFGSSIKELDGIAFVVGSHNLFVFCRHVTKYHLRTLANDFACELLTKYSIASTQRLYELNYDWKLVNYICEGLGCWNNAVEQSTHVEDVLEPTSFASMADIVPILQDNIRKRHRGRKMSILLVEDDPIACRLVSRLLKDEFEVVTAHSAEDAVIQYVSHAPDLVFLDIGLPDFNGFSVMNIIRKYDPNAYFVMFSGSSYAENITRSIHLGAQGFVEKPFRKERLYHYIEDCNKRRQPFFHYAVD